MLFWYGEVLCRDIRHLGWATTAKTETNGSQWRGIDASLHLPFVTYRLYLASVGTEAEVVLVLGNAV
jgi:hypothetical protein